MEKIVWIKCESDSPSFDQGVRGVVVTRETDGAWFGYPLSNSACPVLEWPKVAWREIR